MALSKAKRKQLAEAGFTKRDIDDLDGMLAEDDDDDEPKRRRSSNGDDEGEVAILRGSAVERFLAGFAGPDDDDDDEPKRRRSKSKDDDDDDEPEPKRRGWFG
jgi:hypothetical protein